MDKSKKRADLLQAAIEIVNEQGTNYLTLDAVAKRAGVSKGGLLYHFSSKQALIEGLVAYAYTTYRENVNQSVTWESMLKVDVLIHSQNQYLKM